VREEDIVDPRVVPRWVPVGVSGVPRSRDWDAVVVAELPELEGDPLEEIVFVRLPDGSLGGFGSEVPASAVERLAAHLDPVLRPPYEARAVRRGTREWSVGARSVNVDLVALPESLEADTITLAVSPDGSSVLLVDGEEETSDSAELEAAAAELRRHGRLRAPAFAARAERIGPGCWTLTVDPL
jgi:hypothetical protein